MNRRIPWAVFKQNALRDEVKELLIWLCRVFVDLWLLRVNNNNDDDDKRTKTALNVLCFACINFETVFQFGVKDNVSYMFQEEEVDDEDISDTEITAVPACELQLLHF